MMCCILATIFSGCFLISCPNLSFAGVTMPYKLSTNSYSEPAIEKQSDFGALINNLESPCNNHCKCNKKVYEPVSIF